MSMPAMTASPALAESRDHFIRSQLSTFGLSWLGQVSWNEGNFRLVQKAVARGEGHLAASGALVVETGAHTGRSPRDKFVVLDDMTARRVWWDNNAAISPQHFATLKADMLSHARMKDMFVQDLEAAPASRHRLGVRLIAETAWAALFLRHLLKPSALPEEDFTPGLTLLCLPSFKANPARHGTRGETAIVIDLNRGEILIAGTAYAGEMKKAVFTVLNDLLPAQGVLPMHAAATVRPQGDTAVFFGLSGTGKTTLSADPGRNLIGDDEHGWGEDGLFNIEHGCYAKALNLDATAEPAIHAAALRFGTVLENVALDAATGEADFADGARTLNTRAAYPLSAIPQAKAQVMAPHPRAIVMLTADAFGVLPPVAKLSTDAAIDQFLLGYTSKLAGTEHGVKEPEATFSACFGAPFLPRRPAEYAELLRSKIERHGTQCYLLNTGWTGGPPGVGSRLPLPATRKMLAAILDGSVDQAPNRLDPVFGWSVPAQLAGIDSRLLDPREAWADAHAYDRAAQSLAAAFAARKV